MYVQKIYDIVAYTYRADQYCATCMEEIALAKLAELCGVTPPWRTPMDTEGLLNLWADHQGIDREQEHTYDSGVFPKVVFRSMIEQGETCGQCGEVL